MQEKKIFVHIGHEKTGSTALQRTFQESANALSAAGCFYPPFDDAGRCVDLDKRNPIGNARHFLEYPREYISQANAAAPADVDKIIFSSEFISIDARAGDAQKVAEAARAEGFDTVKVLLFCRDPMSFAVSLWMQQIKDWHAETRDLDDWVVEAFKEPERIAAIAEEWSRTPGIELTALRYDLHRQLLGSKVEEWMDIERGVLGNNGRIETFNRSLTNSEAALQLALNRAIGQSGMIFAFRLINRLPNVPREPINPHPAVWEEKLRLLAPCLDMIDAVLSDYETLDRSLPDSSRSSYNFSAEQLEVIAEGIAEGIAEAVDRRKVPQPLTRKLRTKVQKARAKMRRLLRFDVTL